MSILEPGTLQLPAQCRVNSFIKTFLSDHLKDRFEGGRIAVEMVEYWRWEMNCQAEIAGFFVFSVSENSAD